MTSLVEVLDLQLQRGRLLYATGQSVPPHEARRRRAFNWQLRGQSETRAAAYSGKRLTVVQEGWTLEKQLLVKRAIPL